MLSRMAKSTRPSATPSTARAAAIMVRRRCPCASWSALDARVRAPDRARLLSAPAESPSSARRASASAALALSGSFSTAIGAHEAQPAVEILAVAGEARGEADPPCREWRRRDRPAGMAAMAGGRLALRGRPAAARALPPMLSSRSRTTLTQGAPGSDVGQKFETRRPSPCPSRPPVRRPCRRRSGPAGTRGRARARVRRPSWPPASPCPRSAKISGFAQKRLHAAASRPSARMARPGAGGVAETAERACRRGRRFRDRAPSSGLAADASRSSPARPSRPSARAGPCGAPRSGWSG